MNKIEICNFALSKVGERPIVDLPPAEDTENSRRCDWFLRIILEDLLAKHNWRFAQKELALTQLSGVTSVIGEYIYNLPGDCLRPIDVLPLGHVDSWHILGSRLICNYDSVTLTYIDKNAANGPYPPWFANAVAHRLAADLGPAVSRENDYIHVLNAAARVAFDEAKTTDANQGNEYPYTNHNPREDSFVTGVSQAR